MDAKRILTGDGSHSLVSEYYGVPYHSVHGAVQESAHVFINAGLAEVARWQNELYILEVGFGTGLNAFMTLLESERLGVKVNYVALETTPVDEQTVRSLNYPEVLGVAHRNRDFFALHTSAWDCPVAITPSFMLDKRMSDALMWGSPPAFHLVYFDAFAPAAQPGLWEKEVLDRYFEGLLPGGIFTTYCAKGVFKRNLKAAGFEVEPLPGPPGKREMTRARKPAE